MLRALSSATQVACSSVCQHPTRSITSHPCLLTATAAHRTCFCRSDGSKLHHGGAVIRRCSKANVDAKTKGKPLSVTTPVVQASYAPCYRPPTRSKACTNPPHGPPSGHAIHPTTVPRRHVVLSIRWVKTAPRRCSHVRV